MSENKFIKHLKGVATEGSVLEIKNQATPASFANMPSGDSNPNTIFSDHRGNTTAVLNGTDNWKLNDSALTLATTVYGDGQDLTGTFTASGAGLWINATYSFSSAKIFNGNTKWVLKLCGSNLLAESETIGFTLLVKLNNDTIITKDFTVSEQAGSFCKEFVIDFAEGEPDVVHMESGDTLTVQLLCADSTASATIYNGMTVLTALQRRVAGDTVSSDTYTFDEVVAELDNKVSKSGDTMSGALNIIDEDGTDSALLSLRNGANTSRTWFVTAWDSSTVLSFTYGNGNGYRFETNGFVPTSDNTYALGNDHHFWKNVYAKALNNGADIAIPTTGGTMALTSDLSSYVLKTGDQMTGTFWLKGYLNLRNQNQTNSLCWCAGSTNDRYKWGLNSDINNVGFQYDANLRALMPLVSGAENLGRASFKWNRVYASYLDSSTGGNKPITIPQKMGTMALMDDVELAAQSGRMLTDQGVWYAKMDALGTIPASAEVEGRNYADFTQVDGNNNPIIVIYTYTSGAWVQTETITPPSAYDGYVPITSKIWDIPEQTGQQGGRILWNHTSKDFTPYPLIVSFDGANITNGAFQGSADLSGTSTVTIPVSPSSAQIVNKDYVDTAIAAIPSSTFDLFDYKWRDSTTSNTSWALSDGNWINKADAETAYQHLVDDIDGITTESETIAGITISFYRAPDGHKICPASEESNVAAIYTATGVAWYYVLDTVNQQFKLPRENPSKELIIASKARIAVTETGHASGTTWVPTISASTPANGTDQRALYQQSGAAYSNLSALTHADGTTASPDFVFNDTIADIDTARTGYAGKQYLYFFVGA